MPNFLFTSELRLCGFACEQVNSVYIAQLQAVLTWRQSIGIVGGRPSSSLYFIGYQHEHVLYLDPHEVQPVSESVLAVLAG